MQAATSALGTGMDGENLKLLKDSRDVVAPIGGAGDACNPEPRRTGTARVPALPVGRG